MSDDTVQFIEAVEFSDEFNRLDIINTIDEYLKELKFPTNKIIVKIDIAQLDNKKFKLIFTLENQNMKDKDKNKIPNLHDLLKELSDAGLTQGAKMNIYPINLDDAQEQEETTKEDNTLMELEIIRTAVDIVQRIENVAINASLVMATSQVKSSLHKYTAAIEKKYIAAYLNPEQK